MIRNKNIKQKFDCLIFLGDIHTSYYSIYWFLKDKNLENVAIVQVGDFGAGLYEMVKNKVDKKSKHDLKFIDNFLETINSKVFVIRGNHDNPKFFKGKNYYDLKNIHFLKDYTILNLNVDNKNERIFCLGGAISIDRKKLLAKGQYSKEEEVQIVLNKEILKKIKKISIIVTHTAPDFLYPYGINNLIRNFAERDHTLIDDLWNERRDLTYLMDYVIKNNEKTLRFYFYGHFHQSYYQEQDGINYRLLSIGEFYSI